ncbi:unnamed protein product [Sphacelaria rigidula]
MTFDLEEVEVTEAGEEVRDFEAEWLKIFGDEEPLPRKSLCELNANQVESVRRTECDSTSDCTSGSTTDSDSYACSSSTLEYVATAATALAETCISLQGAVEREREDLRRKIDERRRASAELREELACERRKNEALAASERELQEVLSSRQQQHEAKTGQLDDDLARAREENSQLHTMMKMAMHARRHR